MTSFLSSSDGLSAVNLETMTSVHKRKNILTNTIIGGPQWELVTHEGVVLDHSDYEYESAAAWLCEILETSNLLGGHEDGA